MLDYKKVVVDSTWGERNLRKYLDIYDADFGRFIKKSGNNNALEIGSGRGELLFWLSERFDKVVGLEIDRQMYKSQIPELKKKKNVMVKNEDAFDYLKNLSRFIKYDLVIINEMLEHVEPKKIIRLLRYCYFTLRENGMVIIRSPNAESPFFGAYYRYIDITHTISFTKKSLVQYLVGAGFEPNKVSIHPTYRRNKIFFILAYYIRRALEKLFALTLFLYLGSPAFGIIFTPNLIAVAKK